MTEQSSNEPIPEAIPEVAVKSKRNFSIVWLIPLVAAIIGVFLAYKAISEQGPTITISFKTAAGLEAEKTKIRFKNVEVGQVTAISLAEDLSGVIVTAELRKGAKPYLTDETRFWVVRARVAAGEVSGLGTLFSGAYIAIDPVSEGKRTRSFVGLEKPPVITTEEPGRHFILKSARLGSLDVGSPVFYRQIQVGKVTEYQLDADGRAITGRVFIRAPHDELVRQNTRFWNASGLDVSLTAEGIKVDTDSFVSMLLGGIEFDTPESLGESERAEKNHVFNLYANRAAVEERTYAEKRYYLLYFDGSVRGLTVGAPVEFRGIKIGEVVDIRLQFDVGALEPRIPVLIQTEPDRIESVGGQDPGEESYIEELVEKGLRAQLRTGSILTGQLFVDIDMFPDAKPAKLHQEGAYPVIPTLPTPLEEIRASVISVLAKLEKLPIEEIGKHLESSMAGIDRLVNSPELAQAIVNLNGTIEDSRTLVRNLDAQVAQEAALTLEQAQITLAALEGSLGPNSELQGKLSELMEELAGAARSIRLIADYLERHPEALIRGKQQ